VLGVMPGLVGTLQALEAIKLIIGMDETLTARVLTLDAKTQRCRSLRIPADPSCPACGQKRAAAGASNV
jgi:molybdopterin/thiamine biosynthesis adenylyltransferase